MEQNKRPDINQALVLKVVGAMGLEPTRYR